MNTTLCVLGIDAADYALLEKWDCENLLLNNHQKLETFSHSIEEPATLEVWPTIATGVSPDVHGVYLHAEERSGMAKSAAIRVNQLLPEFIQTFLRTIYRRVQNPQPPQTDYPHAFQPGSVANWPGVTPCSDWETEGEWFKAANNGEMGGREFEKRHLGNAGRGIGWLAGQKTADVPVSGVHIHLLDHLGHLYADKPDQLRGAYNAVDGLVGWLREAVDRLLIISDHGMQTTVTNDDSPGVHSWRAAISSTESGPLPKSVFEVREWIDRHTDDATGLPKDSQADVAAPQEHLEDLGYL